MRLLRKMAMQISAMFTMSIDLKIDFCVVGAQKAASSYLQFALDEHPCISAPKGEITLFENNEYYKIENYTYVGLNEHSGLSHRKIKGIKRPTYLTNPLVPHRLYKYNPNMKIIAILRDPVKRFYSAYHHLVKSGYLTPITIDEFIDACINNPKLIEKNARTKSLFEYGLYAKGLYNYIQLFPMENIKIVLTEDLNQDREKFFNDVYKFLGVESYAPKISKNSRPMKSVSNQSRITIWNYLNSKLCSFSDDKMRGYGPKNQVSRILLKALDIFDNRVLSKIFRDRSPCLHPIHESFLRQYYKKDIIQLEKILRTNLNTWK